MKRLSSISLNVFGMALVLTSALLLAQPPTTAFAATCFAYCQHGSDITVSGDECSCKDNDGCTYVKDGKKYSQKCARPGGDEILIEE